MKPHALGHILETDNVTVFFGDRMSSPEKLAPAFPHFSYVYLNQTHSDIVVEADQAAVLSGDAHLTSAPGRALCIRTADCLPVMIYDPDTDFIAAIHAGWRGIENEIVRKSCARLRALGSALTQARAWIGPHIEAKSFEVGRDVAARLSSRFAAVRDFSDTDGVILPHANSEKAFVDLLSIARAQLHAEGIKPDRQRSLPIDTFASPQHASFRRDAGAAGRQVSFVAIHRD